MSRVITLRALDGSNPLAFLAAVGTLRLLGLIGSPPVRMRWVHETVWCPQIDGFAGSDDELSAALLAAPRVPVESFSELGNNITVEAMTFQKFVSAASNASRQDRRAADFAVSFGSESREDKDKNRIYYTDFCFITGSGHQHFLRTMESLIANVTMEHVRNALFGPWRTQEGLSMRWDPKDAAQYALRWSDPGPEGASAVWGANRLAIEALPLFPAQPMSQRLRTTGFHRPQERGEWPQFTWPIWDQWAALDTVRSLLSLAELQAPDDEFTRTGLTQRGVGEVFRAQRVRIGQGANFKVSFRPSRAL